MKKQYYIKNIATLRLDESKCNGCGMCMEVCPHEVFVIAGQKASIDDLNACMECGACALNCPTEAISVRSGVGCAAAVIQGAIKNTEPSCGCSGEGSKPSCC